MFGYIVNDFKFVIQQHHGEHNTVFIINQILQELLKQKASTSLIGAMILKKNARVISSQPTAVNKDIPCCYETESIM